MASSPPGNTSVLAGILPSNASDAAAAAEDPRAAYLDSCRDLAGAIASLEAALRLDELRGLDPLVQFTPAERAGHERRVEVLGAERLD